MSKRLRSVAASHPRRLTKASPREIYLVLPLRLALGRRVLEGIATYFSDRDHLPFNLMDSTMLSTNLPKPLIADTEPMLGAIPPFLVKRRNAAQRRMVVNVMHRWAEVPVNHVLTDDERIGRMAADYFLEKKLPHLAYVGATTGRLQGYVARVKEAGLEPDFFLLPDTGAYEGPGLRERLARLPRGTGVHTYNDRVARRVIEGLLAEGRAIPEDIAVVGVDDDLVECLLSPVKISAINPHFYQVGWQAAALIDQIIQGAPPPAAPILVPPIGLIERQSSDFPAVGDPYAIQAARLIRREATCGITVAEVATQIPLSRRPLERRFREAFGYTLHDQIRRDKLSEAVRLLASTRLTIAEIAERSGFSDPKQFNKIFRQQFGKTPSDYRRHSDRATTLSEA